MDGPWDAAIVLGNTLLRYGRDRLPGWIDDRLRPGGAIAFGADVRLNDHGDAVGLPAECASADGLRRLFEGATGWRPAEAFDGSLSDATLDRLVVAGSPNADNPHFITRVGDTLLAPSIWFFHKDHPTPTGRRPEIDGLLRGSA